jgi:hypothetical protein
MSGKAKKVQEKTTCGVYEVTNKNTKFMYVGASKRIEICFKDYMRYLERGVMSNKEMQADYNKHGADSFKLKILQECSADELAKVKKDWLTKKGLIKETVETNKAETKKTEAPKPVSKAKAVIPEEPVESTPDLPELPDSSKKEIEKEVKKSLEKTMKSEDALVEAGSMTDLGTKVLRDKNIMIDLKTMKVPEVATKYALSTSMIRKIKKENQ